MKFSSSRHIPPHAAGNEINVLRRVGPQINPDLGAVCQKTGVTLRQDERGMKCEARSIYTGAGRLSARQTDRQMDGWADGQAERQVDRQTDSALVNSTQPPKRGATFKWCHLQKSQTVKYRLIFTPALVRKRLMSKFTVSSEALC